MIRNRKLLKAITAFLILETLFNTVAPTISWALTAGPSAPEFSSFEPVDTTDMVNLATGDLVYNMPLLEVPGPSGGYPMSLSYHAGIKMDQEASWVGLGWSLNPGAINRTVNGFADDNNNVRREVRDYWDGGETTTKSYSLGINAPGLGISMSYSLARTQDTFKGFSSNSYYSGTVGTPYASVSYNSDNGISASAGPVNVSSNGVSVGPVNVSSEGISASLDPAALLGEHASLMGITGKNALEFSLSSKGVKASVTTAGQKSNQKNGNAGLISSYSYSKNIGAIRCGLGFFGIKEFYTRYWSDQSDALYSFGSLYSAKSNGYADGYQYDEDVSEFKAYSNDIYDIYEANAGNWYDQADPARQIGGSFPAYDMYSVAAQGLNGLIEPFIFENGDIKGQNLYERHPLLGGPMIAHPMLTYNILRGFTTNKKIDFRFKNDFSNSLTIDPAEISTSPTWSIPTHAVIAAYDGYLDTSTKQQLAGSKHIEWFTNQEIRSGSAKAMDFIDCYAVKEDRPQSMEILRDYLQPEACARVRNDWMRGKAGSGIIATDSYPEKSTDLPHGDRYNSLQPRNVSLNDKVGGFMITNESGVTYHYAQPVYAYNEYTRLKMKKPLAESATITEVHNDEPYAYTWLLTAITGPDFVDRGGPGHAANGILDDEDYGYWVKFDYGKWTDSYQWRTPHTGYVTDVESEYASFSYGIKELYYLDAIETRSHKAFFVKSKREDGRGVTSRLEGGSKPRRYKMRYKWYEDLDGFQNDGYIERGVLAFSVSPVSTLKLDAVYLFDKKDLASIPVTKEGGDKYDNAPISAPYMYPFNELIDGVSYSSEEEDNFPVVTLQEGQDYMKVKYHNGDLVFDDEDLATLDENHDFKKKALRTIVFNTDYSLAYGVPNAIGYFSALNSEPCATVDGQSTCTPAEAVEGKKLDFEWPFKFGSEEADPPYCCGEVDSKAFYAVDPLLEQEAPIDNDLDFLGNGVTYIPRGKLTLTGISVLGEKGISLIPPTKFAYHKNAGYSNKVDEWGFFKSDYTSFFDPEESPASDEPVYNGDEYYNSSGAEGSRRITPASAPNTYAWSLATISTPLGGSINFTYEPNTYSQSVYNSNVVFGIRKTERIGSTKVKLYFTERGFDVSSFFQTNQYIDVKAFIVCDASYAFDPVRPYTDLYNVTSNRVASVGTDYVEIESSVLNEYLRSDRAVTINDVQRELTPYFIAGAVGVTGNTTTNKYTGGIRVKSISTNVFGGHTSTVTYDYNKPGTALSSGVTSYVPFNAVGVHFPQDVQFFTDLFNDEDHQDEKRQVMTYKSDFVKTVNNLYGGLMTFIREAPAPGSFYEFVTVRNAYDGNELDQYVTHQFQVFRADMITIDRTPYSTNNNLKEVNIENKAVDVGNLLKTSVYARDNQLLSETKYGYLYDGQDEVFETSLQASKQGIVEQAFQKRVLVQDWNIILNDSELINTVERGVVTKKRDRSNALTSVEQHDIKNAVSTKTQYTGFDFYSGQVTSTITTDPSGNRYQTVIRPAYTVPIYSGMQVGQVMYLKGMGLKLRQMSNKHMLTQVASSTTARLEGYVALVSATAQTWSRELPVLEPGQYLSEATSQSLSGIWRKSASYSFIGTDNITLRDDGLYNMTDVTSFDAWSSNDPITTGWQKDAAINLYDVNSHELEAVDLNGHFAATRMSFDNAQVIATISNAQYREFAFCGGEQPEISDQNLESDGLISIGGERRPTASNPAPVHTGLQSVYGAPGVKAISYYLKPDRTNDYTISLWTTNTDVALKYEVNGTAQNITKKTIGQAGEWYLVEGTFSTSTVPAHIRVWVEAVGSAAYIDDFRFFPSNASMSSFVYDDAGRLSHILNSNNLFTEFKYDAMGRLEETFQESFSNGRVKTGKAIYHYADQD